MTMTTITPKTTKVMTMTELLKSVARQPDLKRAITAAWKEAHEYTDPTAGIMPWKGLKYRIEEVQYKASTNEYRISFVFLYTGATSYSARGADRIVIWAHVDSKFKAVFTDQEEETLDLHSLHADPSVLVDKAESKYVTIDPREWKNLVPNTKS